MHSFGKLHRSFTQQQQEQQEEQQEGLTFPWGTRHSSGSFNFSDCSSQRLWWVSEETKDSATLVLERSILWTPSRILCNTTCSTDRLTLQT